MSRDRHPSGRPWRRARAQMFALWGDICHICGHPGATEADHLIPLAVVPTQLHDPMTMRPAHGGNGKCPVCRRACNASRKARAIDDPRIAPRPHTSRAW